MPRRTPPRDIKMAVEMVERGASVTEAALAIGVARQTLARHIAVAKAQAAPQPAPTDPPLLKTEDAELVAKGEPSWLARFIDGIRAGGVPDLAAEYAGVTRSEFERWLDTHATEVQWRRIMSARGEASLRLVATVAQAAEDGQWQAAAWLLQNMRPDVVGPKVALDAHKMGRTSDDRITAVDMVRQMVEQIAGAGGPQVVLARNLNDPDTVTAIQGD